MGVRQAYQLLKALLPGVGLLVLLGVDLVKLPWLRVHHWPCVLKHLHVEPLPARQRGAERDPQFSNSLPSTP